MVFKTLRCLALALTLTASAASAQTTVAIDSDRDTNPIIQPGFPGTDAGRNAGNPSPANYDVCRKNEAEFYPYDCTAGTTNTGSTGGSGDGGSSGQ